MVRLFLAWWLRQLTGLLPNGLRPTGIGGTAVEDTGDCVLLSLGTPGTTGIPTVEAARRRGKRRLVLGRFSLDSAGLAALRIAVGTGRHGPVRLLLPPSLLLEQPVTLPLQAERGLETALRWEMDRLTPFPAEAVHWAWRVVGRDRVRGQLSLRLILVAKAAVQSAVDALAGAGLGPARLEAAGEPGRSISLVGGGHGRARNLQVPIALGLVVILMVAVIAVPFVRQQTALDQLGEQVAALRPQVDAAEVLRRRVADRAASLDVVAAEAARVGNTLGTLAVLTDLLPDDTSLYELSLRDRVATFSGQSVQAARLIALLAADPAVRNPAFSAPVVRNEVTHTETFAIRAEMQP